MYQIFREMFEHTYTSPLMVYVDDKKYRVSFKFVRTPSGPMNKQLVERMMNIQFHNFLLNNHRQ
jgi:hypothetical protein